MARISQFIVAIPKNRIEWFQAMRCEAETEFRMKLRKPDAGELRMDAALEAML
jgi:hypothetical protein